MIERAAQGADRLPALVARGRRMREVLKRADHGVFDTVGDRDALAILEDQNRARLPELVPVRRGAWRSRRSRSTEAAPRSWRTTSPTGGALASTFDLCGDAHIANFGLYASPERRLVADLNDFDEAAFGPWEWDVKRLAASVVLGGRQAGLTPGQCRGAATATASRYIVLLVGPLGEPLFLQAKEAQPSVLVTYGGLDAQLPPAAPTPPRRGVHGFRVVSAQRMLQAVSDPFLGWARFRDRDYYLDSSVT